MVDRVRGGRMREAALESGHFTEADLDEIGSAWEEWEGRDDASLGMMHGEIIIQK